MLAFCVGVVVVVFVLALVLAFCVGVGVDG